MITRVTASGLVVDFAAGTVSGGFSGTFANMERAQGGDGADRFMGAAGGQILTARGGNDTLAGGAGIDTLWGGTETDAFVFGEFGTANADRLSDFSSGTDEVHLDDAAFAAIGAAGAFAARESDKSQLLSIADAAYIGYGAAFVGVLLLLLNLVDGLRRLARRRHHIVLRAVLIAIYVILSVRLAQLLFIFRNI